MTVFVFGSNLAGLHIGGAARHAREKHGAEMGVGEGRTGDAYALPTLDGEFQQRSLAEIRASVARFFEYAAAHPEDYFFVTRVGCGIAGFTDEQIGPMFAGAPPNCGFDPAWSRFGLPSWFESEATA